MTRDVLIRISGLQQMDDDASDVEVITAGEYFWKNGKHYVIYDELMEGFDGSTRNTVKITPEKMDIHKKGIANADMVFEKNCRRLTRYATPMGEMIIEIGTNQIQVEEEEDSLKVTVNYSLDINYEHVSDCNIILDVCSRAKAELRL